jgi:hypothetical protein
MIDPTTAAVLTVVAGVYIATSRTLPPWVVDALVTATMDPTMPMGVAQRAGCVLHEAEQFDCEAA